MASSSVRIQIDVKDLKAFRIAYDALVAINAYAGENIVELEMIASDALYRIEQVGPMPGQSGGTT